MIYDIPFTKKAFDTIQRIDNKDTEYRVIGKPHLRVFVYKTRVSLAARSSKGRRPCKTFGTYPLMNLRTFERLGDEWYRRQLNLDGPDYSRVTYDQFFFELHLPYIKQRHTDWRKTEQQYLRHVQPHLGHLKFPEIKTYQFMRVLNAMHDSGLSDATKNRIRSLMHRSCSLGVKFEILDRNPCSVIEKYTEDNIVERFLTLLEAAAFIKSALDDQNSLQGLAVLAAVFIGGRIHNIISLKKSDLAPDLSTATFTRTKSKKNQVIPLSEQAQWIHQQALSLSDKSSPYVFSSTRSQSGHIAYPLATFKRICERARIATTGCDYEIDPAFPKEPLTIHCLRKSFGSAVLAHTGDIHCSSKLLGHCSVDVTSNRYAFYQQARVQEAVEGAATVLTEHVTNFPKIGFGLE